ncbi:MAG: NAD(P)/FAD-dependent oxidoreductase [Myxococcales bacterium]|nr:NAD(P)/FAD-dependent oxidoreductase [Myxococcales bacterium]
MSQGPGQHSDLEVEVAIVGAGVIGLACAAVLARRGREVVVLERHGAVGQETSSRNSGVIHAGLYYPPGSLKAQLCVRGRELVYARCERDGIGHARCGKLVVATDAAEEAKLEQILARATANGVPEVRMLGAREFAALEPRVRAIAALTSTRTGIVDAHGLMESYRAEARAHGAELALSTELVALEPSESRIRLLTRSGAAAERFAIDARRVINAAGLAADRVAAMAGLDVRALGLEQGYCKGDYFALASRLRGAVSQLIYPVPLEAGLGIHITLDLSGQLRLGPDTEYIDGLDEHAYRVDEGKAAHFAHAVRRYFPELRDEDLRPDYAGVRPKLQRPGQPMADFHIEEASTHGAPGLVNLIGMESPGLTSSEAIAEHVAALLEEMD